MTLVSTAFGIQNYKKNVFTQNDYGSSSSSSSSDSNNSSSSSTTSSIRLLHGLSSVIILIILTSSLCYAYWHIIYLQSALRSMLPLLINDKRDTRYTQWYNIERKVYLAENFYIPIFICLVNFLDYRLILLKMLKE